MIPETCPKCGAVKSYEIKRTYGPRDCDGVRYRCGRGIYEDGLCEEGSVTCDGVEPATPIMDARKALEKANQNEIIGMRQELVTDRQEIAALKVDVALWRKTSGETKDGWDNCANDLAAMRQRAEKAEAERDEARESLKRALVFVTSRAEMEDLDGCNNHGGIYPRLPGQTCRCCEAEDFLAALPEWARGK